MASSKTLKFNAPPPLQRPKPYLRLANPLSPTQALAADRAASFTIALLRYGLITQGQLLEAMMLQRQGHGSLTDILLAQGVITGADLYAAMETHWEAGRLDGSQGPPDIRLIDTLGADFCLRNMILPWRTISGLTLIATSDPERFAHHRPWLEDQFGAVAMQIASAGTIRDSLLHLRGDELAKSAEERVPDAESCRRFRGRHLIAPLLYTVIISFNLTLIWSYLVPWLLLAWGLFCMACQVVLKLSCAIATLRAERHPEPDDPELPPKALPVVSIMVALYREADIADRLIMRLGRLDYPRDKLDVLLVVEAEDHLTRNALTKAKLPSWMRVVVVPKGEVKTKPRALNFALGHCRGSIIGVYDAEDAPEPDQIRRIAQRFFNRGPKVACLQGVLDFYNPKANWLARCFTIEYATWFRLFLPGLSRLKLPIPLGGTTLFFRRYALEAVGGWDAHNVTEDADLGIRLYRHGYRTELVATTTYEEANCRLIAWIKQRSRWQKGFMMTWVCHMRAPRQLYRDLGLRSFLGVQLILLGSLSQTMLSPLLLSFWWAFWGLPHPLADAIPYALALGMMAVFLLAEALNVVLMAMGLARSGQPINRLWAITMQAYFPLAALSCYKAAWELLFRPFYWDKTSHGHLH